MRNPGILQRVGLQPFVEHGDTRRGADVNPARVVLGDGADLGGAETVGLIPLQQLSPVHHGHAVVVGADPEPILLIHVQTHDAGKAVGGIHPLKAFAVIADQTAVTADPDKALAGLRDIVCLLCRQSVGVVVQHRREGIALRDGVHSRDRLRGFGEGRALRRQKQRRQKQRQQKAQEPPTGSGESKLTCHRDRRLSVFSERLSCGT